ncbi:MAG: PKD domain-containing protein [Methanobacteriota archaeon]|nr:MAG: PKD domain-containing protein [Euryarchaeota archaeon]
MAAVMLMGLPTLNLGGGEEFSAVGSAKAQEYETRDFVLGVGELTADSLNTNTATMVSEYLLIFYCYSYLMGYDVDMNIVGDLATSWEASPDGLTWDIEIVDNALFYDPRDDSTHAVTANDVAFTYWGTQNNPSGRLYSYFPGVIDDIVVHNATALTIELNKIHAPIIESFMAVPILPEYYWSGNDFLEFSNLPPIGSGPLYYATDGLPDEGACELRRNPVWFQTENKGWQLHTTSWWIVEYTSEQSAMLDLEDGVLDCYLRLPAHEYLNVMPTFDNIVGFSHSGGFVYEYNLNQMTDALREELGGNFNPGDNNQLLLDETVKMAMAMAIDKDAFVADILLGLGSYADSLIPPGNPGHYWIPDPIECDRAAARQMLWDAGWRYDRTGGPASGTTCPLAREGGTDVLSFEFVTLDTGVVWENAANLIVGWNEEIGVELDLEIKTVSEMNSIWYSADYDVWLWDWVMGVTSDPSGILEVMTTYSIGSSSDVYWSNETFDALYIASLETIDPVVRQDLWNQMQEMAYWNLGVQCIAYSNDNYAVSTVNWDSDSLGDWNTKYMLLPDISCQWPSMQMYPNNNHAPQFNSYTGMGAVVEAAVGVSEYFTANVNDDDASTDLEVRWFWGDGDSTSWIPVVGDTANAYHTYAADGIYEAWVAVREASLSNGYEDYFITSKMATVEVYDYSNNAPENVDFTFSPTTGIDAGTWVEFTGTATDPEGNPLYYTWDFGGGHQNAGQTVMHQFGEDGFFDVILSVTDNHLGTGTRPQTHSESISVAPNHAPTVSVSDYTDIPVHQVQTYSATANDPEDAMRFTWVWGDGDVLVTTAPTADHIYDVRGTYTLTVHADDLTGLPGHNVSDTALVHTYNPSPNKVPVIAAFTVSDTTPSTQQPVLFSGSVYDQDGDALTVTVDFGDVTYVETIGYNNGETFTVEVEHAYATDDAFTAWLYVDDGEDNTSSSPQVLTVYWNDPPVLQDIPDISAYVGELVTVSIDVEDYDYDDLTVTWVWNDGAVDVTHNVFEATHEYIAEWNDIYRVYVDDGEGHNVSDAAFLNIVEPPFVMNLVEGWNLVTIPLVNHGYNASNLGLSFGDMVSRWDPATQTYDKNYIVGISGSASDFELEPSWSYWVYSGANKSLILIGDDPTASQSRTITVPSGGGWVQVGLASKATDLWASDIEAMYTADQLTMVSRWNPDTQTYSNYLVDFGIGDFQLSPGDGLWLYVDATGVLSYDP